MPFTFDTPPAITFGDDDTLDMIVSVLHIPCEMNYVARITTTSDRRDYELVRASTEGLVARPYLDIDLEVAGEAVTLPWPDVIEVHLY
jgi:hypothetical protein